MPYLLKTDSSVQLVEHLSPNQDGISITTENWNDILTQLRKFFTPDQLFKMGLSNLSKIQDGRLYKIPD